jgi:hypothetical protein
VITALQRLWKRWRHHFLSSQNLAIQEFTPNLHSGGRTWAATHPIVTKHHNGISWKVEIPVPHENKVSVQRLPTCLVISIPKPGARLDTSDMLQLLRRTIALTETTPNGEPQVELEGDWLTITCCAPEVVSCDFSAGPAVLPAQQKKAK